MPGVAPSNLNFEVSSPYTGILTWTNGDDYQYIEVWENKAGGGYGALPKAVIVGGKESYVLTGLDPNTNYCYKILGGWWEPPAETDFTAEDCETTYALLQAPTDIVTTVFSNFVEITWKDNSSEEDHFYIYRRIDGGAWPAQGAPTGIVAANMEYWRDTGVVAGETYDYRLCAQQDAGPTYSAYVTGTQVTANTLPGLVQNVQTSDITDEEIRLTWEAPATGGEVTGYRIQISNTGDFTGEESEYVVDADVLSLLFKDLTADTEYWIRILAYNGVGDGDYVNADDALIDGAMEEWIDATHLRDWNNFGDYLPKREGTIVHGGNFSCDIYTKLQGEFAHIDQNIVMTPGESRKIILWSIIPVDGTDPLRLEIKDVGNNVMLQDDGTWGVGGYITIPRTANWAEFELNFTVHASYSNYNVRLYKGHGPGQPERHFYVDDFRILTGEVRTLAQYVRTEFEVFVRDPDAGPIYIAEIDLKMDLSGFTLTSGVVYEVTIDERGLEIDGVWEDGVALTEKTSIATVEATAQTWWWVTADRKLYVHATGDADPDDFFMEGGFTHLIPSRDFDYADDLCTLPPWLSESSIPGMTQENKPYFASSFRLSTGSISIMNAESKGENYLDKRFETFTWIGAKLTIYCGKETFSTLAQFKKMFSAYISDKDIGDNKIILSLKDIRKELDRNLVLAKYWETDYPGLEEDFEGREKSKAYGYVEGVAPVPLMRYDAAENQSAKFSYHDGRTKDVGKVTVDGTEKTKDTDYYVDQQRSIITFDVSVDIGEEDIVLVSFTGKVNSADEPIENGADIFKHIMNNEANIPTTKLNTDWIYEAKNANTKSLSVLFYKDTPYDEILETIEHTTEAYILQDGDARLGLRPLQTVVPSKAKYIWNFQSKGHRHNKSRGSLYWKVKVYYGENPQSQEWEIKEATDEDIKRKFGIEKDLPINTYFRDPSNAQALANTIIGLLNKTYIVDELPMILFDVFPGDLVPFSRDRFFDSSGTAAEVALRILRVEKNPQTGITGVIMEKVNA